MSRPVPGRIGGPIVRRRSVLQRAIAYPSDVLLAWVETYETLDWDWLAGSLCWPLGIAMNLLFLFTRYDPAWLAMPASSSFFDGLFCRGIHANLNVTNNARSLDAFPATLAAALGLGLCKLRMALRLLLLAISLGNSWLFFSASRKYRMFFVDSKNPPSSPNIYSVETATISLSMRTVLFLKRIFRLPLRLFAKKKQTPSDCLSRSENFILRNSRPARNLPASSTVLSRIDSDSESESENEQLDEQSPNSNDQSYDKIGKSSDPPGLGPTALELALWDFSSFNKTFFCLFSPLQLYFLQTAPLSSATIVLAIMIPLLLLQMCRAFEQLVRDKEIVFRHVMQEYNLKTVYPRIFAPKSDVGVGSGTTDNFSSTNSEDASGEQDDEGTSSSRFRSNYVQSRDNTIGNNTGYGSNYTSSEYRGKGGHGESRRNNSNRQPNQHDSRMHQNYGHNRQDGVRRASSPKGSRNGFSGGIGSRGLGSDFENENDNGSEVRWANEQSQSSVRGAVSNCSSASVEAQQHSQQSRAPIGEQRYVLSRKKPGSRHTISTSSSTSPSSYHQRSVGANSSSSGLSSRSHITSTGYLSQSRNANSYDY